MADTPRQKKQRSCVSCRRQDAKGVLHRIVRDANGGVAYDATGKQAGRGAYVCSQDCFEQARKTRRLERVLRTKIDEKDYDRIAEELASQCAEDRIR